MLPLLAIIGPTASGKTALSVRLAKALDGEVVSADSMQIYGKMDIATAKPTVQEMDGIPHHLVGVLQPEESCNVARYVDMARPIIADITARGRLPMLVGGTGLYVSSILDNIIYSPAAPDIALRERLNALAQREGNEAVHAILRRYDPQAAAELHPNNLGRVIRAIEMCSGMASTKEELAADSRRAPSPYDACVLGITFADRQKLYGRINSRVDIMMESGLLEEARTFRAQSLGQTAAQAIGYKELYGYIDGRCTLEEAVENLKRSTRHYAKRQLTWFRRDSRVHWLYADELGDGLFDAAFGICREHFGGGEG